MNEQKLLMKYHPAKKEVEFHRFHNGKEVTISEDSRLKYYMNKKGKFVLQNFGNDLFDDIAKAFDGLKNVNMEVVTTRLDYEDFVQMVEYYNNDNTHGDCKINPTLLSELPDTNQIYLEVVEHGETSIGVLEKHGQKLFDTLWQNEHVRESAQNHGLKIKKEIDSIREKIDSLNDNKINLCFAGVYSSGKSALINSILGYRVLPEDVKSETAKMFQISSPTDGENVEISFEIKLVSTESGSEDRAVTKLKWNEEQYCFEFTLAPFENAIKESLQIMINKAKEDGLKQHEQIKQILDKLNRCKNVGSFINIKFPVPLDTENLQFAIYDTPGTDSNVSQHQMVLQEALAQQGHSILIFVANPDRLEGEGNNLLLNYLKKVQEKNSKTSIDISRSLFVINKAETVTRGSRTKLQTQEIENKEDACSSIQLSDKKLLFTSAMYAYVAKAIKNGVATEDEQELFQSGQQMLSNEKTPTSFCYRQNKCGTSQVGTDRMIQLSDCAFKEAEKEDDDSEILVITSGLYALEREILEFGERCASTVKASAIIKSVDEALSKIKNQNIVLKESNGEKLSDIEKNIFELEKSINTSIDKVYKEMAIPENHALPKEVLKRLNIDSDHLQRIIGETKNYFEINLKGWFWGHGDVPYREEDRALVRNKIEQELNSFSKIFLEERKKLLEEQRDVFMESVKKAIDENGKISNSAKKIFQDIPKEDIVIPKKVDFGEIYDSHKRIDRLFFIENRNLNKKEFIKELETKFSEVVRKMSDHFISDYRSSLKKLLDNIKSLFTSNLREYSVNMKAMLEDRDAMKIFENHLLEAMSDLEKNQKILDEIIWKEIRNG